jgi:hypothetical protein
MSEDAHRSDPRDPLAKQIDELESLLSCRFCSTTYSRTHAESLCPTRLTGLRHYWTVTAFHKGDDGPAK